VPQVAIERHLTINGAEWSRPGAIEIEEARSRMDAFTMQEFLTMIADNNARFWPVALIAYGLGIAAVVLVLRKATFASTFATGVLALLWLWTGVIFNGFVFSGLWQGALVVAALFVIQAILLAMTGVLKNRLRFNVTADVAGVVGGLAILYALVGYPAVGVLMGRGYQELLLVGLAGCPTVTFTLGWLLWSRRPLPKAVLVIPVLYALAMGGTAASLGIVEDIGLVVTAVVAAGLLLLRDRRVGHALRMGTQGSA